MTRPVLNRLAVLSVGMFASVVCSAQTTDTVTTAPRKATPLEAAVAYAMREMPPSRQILFDTTGMGEMVSSLPPNVVPVSQARIAGCATSPCFVVSATSISVSSADEVRIRLGYGLRSSGCHSSTQATFVVVRRDALWSVVREEETEWGDCGIRP
jgi:hypothetical protein